MYYKDDTHYFVMTAKKASLLEKGVLKQDFSDTIALLDRDNVNQEALLSYAREEAVFSTHGQLSNMECAVNHYGQADVAMPLHRSETARSKSLNIKNTVS